ncbi:MAG: tetratricopeptide repeat protein, partial [bacterium]
YLVLGELEIHAHKWNNAARLMGQAIKLNPYLTQAHYFYALANYYLQQDKEAEDSINKVHNSNDAGLFPGSHYLLGGILEERGEYQAAAVEFRRFLATDPQEDLISEVKSKLEYWQNRGWIKPNKVSAANE